MGKKARKGAAVSTAAGAGPRLRNLPGAGRLLCQDLEDKGPAAESPVAGEVAAAPMACAIKGSSDKAGGHTADAGVRQRLLREM